MATLTFELPSHKEQTELNLRRWSEVLADDQLAKFEGQIETDRHGHIIMTPPPTPNHGSLQAKIASLLDRLQTEGRVYTECPISTADGVKAADVAWASSASIADMGQNICFLRAPEVCIEVVSTSNTDAEMEEKKALYFDAGAQEVWLCDESGNVTFFSRSASDPVGTSEVFPQFPSHIELN